MNELITQLTQQLNVSPEQAKGGAGAIFKLAQEKLGGDFSQISTAIPDITSLMQAAPSTEASGALGGLMGAATSMFGSSSSVGGLATLMGVFQKLNIDSATAMKFAPVVMQFVQSKGGEQCKQLLQKALGV